MWRVCMAWFVGGLKKIQEIKAEPGSALAEYINTINNCYPEEIVKYVSTFLITPTAVLTS